MVKDKLDQEETQEILKKSEDIIAFAWSNIEKL
jgi:hypothetical protein